MRHRAGIAVMLWLSAASVFAQGEDSAAYERDLQVIAVMLPGQYVNANQAYFDVRGDRPIKHGSIEVNVEALRVDSGEEGYFVSVKRGDEAERFEYWTLSGDAARQAVRMRMRTAENLQAAKSGAFSADDDCSVHWRREAAQFRATGGDTCAERYATELVLSEAQLWMRYVEQASDGYQLHRARTFECYADMPGVGGGRDEAYERYGEFAVHDQGGAAWFTSKEGRRMGISLFLVDWPINNLKGIFTRNSLVVYVNEEIDGTRKEHGYAFTLPEADRIGINLKWILVNCYMESNAETTPSF